MMAKKEKVFAVEDLLTDVDEILENAHKLSEVLDFHIKSAAYFLVQASQALDELKEEKEGK
jgi:hypothetical protein